MDSMDELVFQKKKPSVRLRFLFGSGLFLLLGALLIGAAYFVLYSDFWKVKGFEVRNLKFTAEESLLAALNSAMIGNSKILSLLSPENILFWEFSDKPKNLDTLPLLAQLSITTDLAAKKIILEVKERNFLGIWCGSKGDCYAFDEEGIIFARAPEAKGALILKLNDENNRPLVLGQPVFTNPEWKENVFKVVEIMKNRKINISRLTIKNFRLEEWRAETSLGPIFYFSLNFVPQNLERILDNLGDKFEFDKVAYFDFRVENRIYYK